MEVTQRLTAVEEIRSRRTSPAASVVGLDEVVPREEDISNIIHNEDASTTSRGIEVNVGPIAHHHTEQYIDPALLQSQIETAIRQGVRNATQSILEESSIVQPRQDKRQTLQTVQEAVAEAEKRQVKKIMLTTEDKSYKRTISLSEIDLDKFMRFLEDIAEFEKCNYDQPIPSVFILIKGRAKETVKHTLMGLFPHVYPTTLSCNDASITDIMSAVKHDIRPLDVVAFNDMLLKSCTAYQVYMDKLEDFKRVDEELCILETKFTQRYEFLVDACKSNGLYESIPLVTIKNGGSLETFMRLIPFSMKDTMRRLLKVENFASVQAFLTEFFSHLKITRELDEKHQQFKRRFRFNFKKKGDVKTVNSAEGADDSSFERSSDKDNPSEEENSVLVVKDMEQSPCYRQMTQEGGCKEKNCKFSHDKVILNEAFKKMGSRLGFSLIPKPSFNAPPQKNQSSNPGHFRKIPGTGKHQPKVKLLSHLRAEADTDSGGSGEEIDYDDNDDDL